MKLAVGVYGAAGGRISRQARELCYQVGQEIARQGCLLLTGACPGLPYEAVKGCRAVGGLTVGVSPALNLTEHRRRYRSPYEKFDVLIYTGDGLMGREVTAVRSCDIVIIAGGRSGTLGEFAIAYDEAKTIGILLGTNGIAEHVSMIIEAIDKETGAIVLEDDSPARLLRRLIRAHRRRPEEKVPTEV